MEKREKGSLSKDDKKKVRGSRPKGRRSSSSSSREGLGARVSRARPYLRETICHYFFSRRKAREPSTASSSRRLCARRALLARGEARRCVHTERRAKV